MKARLEALDLLANNIANQTSPGYKADRESYGLYAAPEAFDGSDPSVVPQPPLSPVIERNWTDHSQGPLTETGNPLDIAISGKGFLEVEGPAGPLYTRNGTLRLSPAGRLETRDGYAVLDSEGQPVTLQRQSPVTINERGEIRQGGVPVATLGIVSFTQTDQLTKRNGQYFQAAATAQREPSGAQIHQGRLEQGNGAAAESAVRLVSLLRQFEMLQRAITIDSEMGQKASELARVGG
jgi:flagellar basal body rod protein FlgG